MRTVTLNEYALMPGRETLAEPLLLRVAPNEAWLVRAGWQLARLTLETEIGEAGAPTRQLWQVYLRGRRVGEAESYLAGEQPALKNAAALALEVLAREARPSDPGAPAGEARA